MSWTLVKKQFFHLVVFSLFRPIDNKFAIIVALFQGELGMAKHFNLPYSLNAPQFWFLWLLKRVVED